MVSCRPCSAHSANTCQRLLQCATTSRCPSNAAPIAATPCLTKHGNPTVSGTAVCRMQTTANLRTKACVHVHISHLMDGCGELLSRVSRHQREAPILLEVDLRGGAQQELPALDCQVVVDFAQSGQLSRQTRASRAAGCSLLASRGTGPRSTFEIEKGQTETTRHRRGASTVTTPPATTATKRAIASSVRGESPDCTAEHCSGGGAAFHLKWKCGRTWILN